MAHVLITRRLAQLSSVAAWPFTSLAGRLFSRRGRHRQDRPRPVGHAHPGRGARRGRRDRCGHPVGHRRRRAGRGSGRPGSGFRPSPRRSPRLMRRRRPRCRSASRPCPPCRSPSPCLSRSVRADVALCGDFNNWDTGPIPLIRDTHGPWQVTVPLAPGTSYRYRYLLDGERWENAWDADRYEPNPYGSDNSVVMVDWPKPTLQTA